MSTNKYKRVVSDPTIRRLPEYLNYLTKLMKDGKENISSTAISTELKLNEVQIRKDLSSVSTKGGKPKTGYIIKELVDDISDFLGYTSLKNVVLMGVGQLGSALISYKGFEQHGFSIKAAFDIHPSIIGMVYNETVVYPNEMLEKICKTYNIEIGIIAVGEDAAQSVCDMLVKAGIKAIWNFAPVHLCVPDDIIVRNENLAASLAILSKQLSTKKGE
jgi:redox-sensing transcriptional repressor